MEYVWPSKPEQRISIILARSKFISLKCYLVASAVWGRVVQVRILVGRPIIAALADVVIAIG